VGPKISSYCLIRDGVIGITDHGNFGYAPMNETQPYAVLAGLLKSRNQLSRFSPGRGNSRLVGKQETDNSRPSLSVLAVVLRP